jgi:hypothetical protein
MSSQNHRGKDNRFLHILEDSDVQDCCVITSLECYLQVSVYTYCSHEKPILNWKLI